MRTEANIVIGDADTTPTSSAHVRGVNQGNSPRKGRRMKGIVDEGGRATGTAARSTGINADRREPIDPRMPNLSPA